MDTFFEQILVRRRKPAELVFTIITVAVGVIAILLMLFCMFIQAFPFSGLLTLVIFGLIVGIYFYLNSMYMEYEYSLTNGDFDIDRIIGKRKRQRLLTTNCSDFEEFGVYTEEKARAFKQRQWGAKVIAANLKDEGLYYAVVRHAKLGTVLLVIEPDDRIKSALRKFIPRQVQGNVLSGDRSN